MPTTITFLETVGVLSGLTFGCIVNFMAKKPLLTGLYYKHAGSAVIGYFTGKRLEQWKEEKELEYVKILDDYSKNVSPLDFVEPPPKTYGQVLMQWHPVR